MLLFFSFQVDHLAVLGDYEVVVRVHSFSNPSGRCDECRSSEDDPRPLCCGATSFTSSCPNATCDTSIDYCFRPLGLGQTGPDCPFGLFQPTRFSFDTNNFTFRDDFFGFPNPRTFTNDRAWMVSGALEGLQTQLP